MSAQGRIFTLVLLLIIGLALLLRWQPQTCITGEAIATPSMVVATAQKNKSSLEDLDRLYHELMSAAPEDEKSVPFKTKARVHLKPGESAVLGFWQMGRDKNSLVIVTPEIHPDAQLQLVTHIVQVTDAALADPNVSDLFPTPFDAEQYGVMKTKMIGETIKQLNKTRGVDFITAPRVMTHSGQQASIHIGERDAGSSMKRGLQLDLKGTTPGDDGGLDLDLGLVLR